MNIFTVLTQGSSRLHEPSISAMLGYLLDSNGDHGFGNRFLISFVKSLALETDSIELQRLSEDEDLSSAIQLEKHCFLNDEKYYLDIQVDLYTTDPNSVECTLIIENKIRSASAKAYQLTKYYTALKNAEEDIITNPIVMVYLTPSGAEPVLQREFNNLTLSDSDQKAWMSWLPNHQSDNNDNFLSVVEFLKKLLSKEVKGEIPPMNEYLRHTLKGFIFHLEQTMRINKKTKITAKDDKTEVVDTMEVVMDDDNVYKIIRRKSQQITVWNGKQQVVAKPMLRDINDEKKLGIDYKDMNTQKFGRLVINALKELEEALIEL